MSRLLNVFLAVVVSVLIMVGILLLPPWIEPWQIGAGAAIVIAIVMPIAIYLSVRKALPSAIAIYLWLIIAGILAAGFVFLLSQLGPYAVIALVAVTTISVTVLSINRLRAVRNRQNPNLCEHCGYDLRASTDRCPECGNEISGDLQRRRRIREEMLAKRAKTAENPAESSGNFPPPPASEGG